MARDPAARRRMCRAKKRKKRRDPEAEKQKRAAKKLDKAGKLSARDERMLESLAQVNEAKANLLDIRKRMVLTDKLIRSKMDQVSKLQDEIDELGETLNSLPDKVKTRRGEYRATIYKFIETFPEFVDELGLEDGK